MQIIEINGSYARCEVKGVERRVSLFLVQDETLVLGDYVLVHVGYALQKISPTTAQTTWEHYDSILGEYTDDSEIDVMSQESRGTEK